MDLIWEVGGQVSDDFFYISIDLHWPAFIFYFLFFDISRILHFVLTWHATIACAKNDSDHNAPHKAGNWGRACQGYNTRNADRPHPPTWRTKCLVPKFSFVDSNCRILLVHCVSHNLTFSHLNYDSKTVGPAYASFHLRVLIGGLT